MNHPEFAQIRQRYRHACGYCGITEDSAGGELTINHYRPRSAGGGDDLDNLVYAYVKCNQYKHDFWPTAEDHAQQRRIVHPLLDDVTHHFALNEQTGHLEPRTETGRFHIALLRLNRPQLIKHRLSQQLQIILREKQRLLAQQISELERTIAAQERYITLLQAHIERLRSTE
jgi:hypothetical protein